MRNQSTCSVDGCERIVYAKTLCAKHYQRQLLGKPLVDPPKVPKLCSVEGCDKPFLARGLCKSHYRKWELQDHPDIVHARTQIYRTEHLDEVKARHRLDYQRHREQGQARSHAYYVSHRAARQAKQREYHERHIEADNARNREYQSTHPWAWTARRKAISGGEPVSRKVVFERDGGRCHICGKSVDPKKWHLDHLVPISKGGEHSYRNVAVSHPRCNLKRQASGPAQLRLTGD